MFRDVGATYLTSAQVLVDSSRNGVDRVEEEAARIQEGKLKGETTDAKVQNKLGVNIFNRKDLVMGVVICRLLFLLVVDDGLRVEGCGPGQEVQPADYVRCNIDSLLVYHFGNKFI